MKNSQENIPMELKHMKNLRKKLKKDMFLLTEMVPKKQQRKFKKKRKQRSDVTILMSRKFLELVSILENQVLEK